MVSLSLEVGQTLDDAWAEQACALPFPAREQLLAQADSLRDREGGIPTAFACYRALRGDLDPAQPTHSDRVAWLLGHARAPDNALEGLARAAAVAERGTELWFLGQFRTAYYDRAAGRLDEAVQRLLTLREHTAGGDAAAEGAVLANLTICFLQQERSVEALFVGRRAIDAQERSGKLRGILHIKLIVARSYARFHDWSRHEALLSSV
ncbi:MAG: hypothetical protein OER88_11160, partial [Planctomycetota bacterium]|nr:hypothetical protein [Planctomycetota bacterium]